MISPPKFTINQSLGFPSQGHWSWNRGLRTLSEYDPSVYIDTMGWWAQKVIEYLLFASFKSRMSYTPHLFSLQASLVDYENTSLLSSGVSL